jgi:hypothetical protein
VLTLGEPEADSDGIGRAPNLDGEDLDGGLELHFAQAVHDGQGRGRWGPVLFEDEGANPMTPLDVPLIGEVLERSPNRDARHPVLHAERGFRR